MEVTSATITNHIFICRHINTVKIKPAISLFTFLYICSIEDLQQQFADTYSRNNTNMKMYILLTVKVIAFFFFFFS